MAFAARTGWGFATILLSSAPLALADNPAIQDIAPRDSFLVVSVPEWPAAKAAFNRSPMGQLWLDKAMQDWIAGMWKEFREDSGPEGSQMIDDLLERVEDLGEPTGAIGGAWALRKAAAAEEGGQPGMVSHMLLMADFGEGAAKVEAEIIEFLEEESRRDRLTLKPVTVAGIDAHEIELNIELDDAASDPDDDFGMDEFGEFGGADVPGFTDLLTGGGEGPIKLFLARSGGAIVVTSQQESLEHALDRLAGANRPHLGESDDWNNAVAQHPRNRQAVAAVFVNDSVRELIRGAGGGLSDVLPLPLDEMGLGIDKVLATLGLAPVKAISLGVKLDAEVGPDVAVEQTIGFLLPEKGGLFTLLDGEGAAFDPPSWIGADVAGVGRFNLRFERIVPMLEEIVKTLPPDLQGLVSGGVQFVKGSFGRAFESMGPELYLVDTISKPFTATSSARIVAIKVRDELTVANAVSGIAAQTGMDSRDFQGAQIYDDMENSFALGLGFGWLFVGEPSGVENAMRRASNPGEAGASLAASDRFRRAVSATSPMGPGLVQSWTDDHQSLDYSIWSARNPLAMMRAEWEGLGLDPEEVDEILQGMELEAPAWMEDMPPVDLFKRYMDSSVFSLRSTPDGFRGAYIILPPRKP
jgi:hypothetical protein